MTKSKSQQRLELIAVSMLAIGGGMFGYNYYQEQQVLARKAAEAEHLEQQATLPPPRGQPPMPIATDAEIEKPQCVELDGTFTALAMAADSPVVLLERNDGKAIWEVWNLQTLNRRSTLALPEPPNWIAAQVSKDGKPPQIQLTQPRPMCLSADGSRAAVMIGYPSEGHHSLCIWDTATGKILRRDYDPDRELLGLQFVDNSTLLCMGRLDKLYVFERIMIDEDRVEAIPLQNRAIEYSQQFLASKTAMAILQNQQAMIISIPSGSIRELNILKAEPSANNPGETPRRNDSIRIALANDGAELYCFQGDICEIWNVAKNSREKRFTIRSDRTVLIEQPMSDRYALAQPLSGFVTTHSFATGEAVAAIGFPLTCECVGLSSSQQAIVLKSSDKKKIILASWKRPLPPGKTFDLSPWLEHQKPTSQSSW